MGNLGADIFGKMTINIVRVDFEKIIFVLFFSYGIFLYILIYEKMKNILEIRQKYAHTGNVKTGFLKNSA